MRDAATGNDLLARYCATSESNQLVDVGAVQDVVVDFHFPHKASGTAATSAVQAGSNAFPASSVELFEEPVDGGSAPVKVGSLSRGNHLAVSTHGGRRLRALESGTQREVAAFVVTYEAKQYVTIGSGEEVALEVALPRDDKKVYGVFNVHRDGEEHLEATLKHGASKRFVTMAGERWIVREQLSDTVVVDYTTGSTGFQKIGLPEPVKGK